MKADDLKKEVARYVEEHCPDLACIVDALGREIDFLLAEAETEGKHWQAQLDEDPLNMLHMALDSFAAKLFGKDGLAEKLENALFGEVWTARLERDLQAMRGQIVPAHGELML